MHTDCSYTNVYILSPICDANWILSWHRFEKELQTVTVLLIATVTQWLRGNLMGQKKQSEAANPRQKIVTENGMYVNFNERFP